MRRMLILFFVVGLGLASACTADRTGFDATCADGEQNQDETDVDCGGNTCGRCAGGASCVFGLDCQSGVCDPASGTCEASGVCGNGTVEDGEGCDDGDLDDGDGCNANCFLEIGEACDLNDQCASAACDTMVTGECVPPGVCGNGIVEAGEGCDQGDTLPGDGCDADCLRELDERCQEDNQCASAVCDDTEVPSVCEPADVCGNSKVEGSEACDDGDTDGGGGCSGSCLFENGESCDSSPECESTVCDPNEEPPVCELADVCGNGTTEGEEGCDDGNTSTGDGCDDDCLREDGQTCSEDAQCQSDICDATEDPDVCEQSGACGNSRLEAFEGCDDGNLENEDGCNENCLLEQGEFCVSGFQCASTVCLGSACQ